jgi:hypothetical protein
VTAQIAATSALKPQQPSIGVGVYYFPGWSTPGGGYFPPDPWSIIPKEKLPHIGAYDETDQAVCDYQLAQMVAYGIDFIMVDWYWDYYHDRPFLDHWLRNYLASTVPNKPKFSIYFCAAHQCNTPKQWHFTYEYWIKNYLGDPNYLKVDGRPVVGFFDATGFHRNLGGGSDMAIRAFLDHARVAEDKVHGTGGIYFVADTYLGVVPEAGSPPGSRAAQGYDAISVYCMISGTEWQLFRDIYFGWNQKALAGPLPIFCPISTGWDDRPWGSINGGFRASPTVEQFTQHLHDMKHFVTNNRDRYKGVIVEAWNEYGEGNAIEPSGLSGGAGRLEALKAVFKEPRVKSLD